MIATAFLISTGPEDDAAYIALHDLTAALAGHPDAKIIGGHMVSLITAAFPSPGLVGRRTNDADVGIPLELATRGDIHAALLSARYLPIAGNRYVRARTKEPRPTIDVLIPATTGKFGDEQRGERVFNTVPALDLALGAGIDIRAVATLRDGSELTIDASVPNIESAVILKAFAWRNRHAETDKDVIDLSNLLHVLDAHGRDALGGWALDADGQTEVQADASRLLHQLADQLDSGSFRNRRVDGRKLAVLIRRHVARA